MRILSVTGLRRFAIAGFAVASVAAAGAAALGGSGWVTAGVAGLSGTLGGFIPGWVDTLDARGERAAAIGRLATPDPPHSVTRYLTAQQAVVPFTGRARETAKLLTWCRDRGSAPVCLVTGQGGVGKTRLAKHVMRQLSGRQWRCVMVDADAEANAWDVARDGTKRRALLVVDYAESRKGLTALLRSVAGAPDPERVRVLLLARGAGEWWESLGAQDSPVRALVASAQVKALEAGLGTDRTDRQLVATPFS